MIKTVLRNMIRTTLVVGLAATTLAGTAEARGFGGFHGGFGGFHHGGFGHHGWGWGHGFGWRGGPVGFSSFYGCYNRQYVDFFGNLVVRRVCG